MVSFGASWSCWSNSTFEPPVFSSDSRFSSWLRWKSFWSSGQWKTLLPEDCCVHQCAADTSEQLLTSSRSSLHRKTSYRSTVSTVGVDFPLPQEPHSHLSSLNNSGWQTPVRPLQRLLQLRVWCVPLQRCSNTCDLQFNAELQLFVFCSLNVSAWSAESSLFCLFSSHMIW